MKRSDFSDEEFGRHLQARYDALADTHAAGLHDEHPAEAYNLQSATLRRVARDNAGNVGEAKEIERTDHAADDPGEFPGKPRNPERGGASVAAGLDSIIPGYSRLGGGNRRDSTRTVDKDLIVRRAPLSGDHRVVDEDGIVVSKRSW